MPPFNSPEKSRIWAVIPVFNNKDTVLQVAGKCRRYLEHVLVVDDGSTDTAVEKLFLGTDIVVLKHAKNLGKGMAIRTALQYLHERGAEVMVTIDADGQHDPRDIERFFPLLEPDNSVIVVGARNFNAADIPQKSRFGRLFSNFWVHLETGKIIADSQSGFRAYPVKYLRQIKTSGRYYDFEIEALIRAVWSGIELRDVPISVFYPPAGLRISSFRPFLDNLRISLMHIRLIGRRLLPLPYPLLVERASGGAAPELFIHPVKLFKLLLKENATPTELAVSAGVGILLGALPLVAMHILAVVYVTTRLHLNRIVALAAQNFCMPPFVPAACIQLGHFLIHKRWLTDITWRTVFAEAPNRLWEWLVGSLILAPAIAIVAAISVYFISRAIQIRTINHAR